MGTLTKGMNCNIIKNTLTEIKSQLGLDLVLYDGILKTYLGVKYFDIELNYPCWMSQDYKKLIKYANKYNTFKVEQTGYCRVGIFLTHTPHLTHVNNKTI